MTMRLVVGYQKDKMNYKISKKDSIKLLYLTSCMEPIHGDDMVAWYDGDWVHEIKCNRRTGELFYEIIGEEDAYYSTDFSEIHNFFFYGRVAFDFDCEQPKELD